MSSLIPFAGLLVCLGGVFLLARSWPVDRHSGEGIPVSIGFSLALLAGTVVLFVVAYGALRGSLIALFVIGGIALVGALVVELRRARRSVSGQHD